MSQRLSDRDLRVIAKRLRPQGWTWRKTGSGHIAWMSPNGLVVFGASTSGGGRGTKNLIAQLRRAGAQV